MMNGARRDRWYAVRCCCTPQKVFGFIRLEDGPHDFRVQENSGQVHQITVRDFCSYNPRPTPAGAIPQEYVAPAREPAIYSDDRPLEFWRSIVGFVEAAPPAPQPRHGITTADAFQDGPLAPQDRISRR